MTAHALQRRDAMMLLGAGALLPLRSAKAQPQRALARVLCGYPPGGSVDVISRKLAERLSGRYAATVIVDNKAGAAGRIVVDELKRAPADGSTMLVTPASVMTLYPHVYRKLSYDVFADVAPVSKVAVTGFALAVGPKVPEDVRMLDGFLRWCKEHPAQAQCGNPGAGSMPHLMAVELAQEAHVELVHVPYRGGLVAMQDVAAGQVSAALATESSTVALEQASKLRVLATSGPQRSSFLPHVPTFREQGMTSLVQREWFGVFMPGTASPEVTSAAAESIAEALKSPEFERACENLRLSVEFCSPAELRADLQREYDAWAPIVRASGFTPEA
jgi:tripartite-type tricarboxylate transporter receptor subunit TctC